MARAISLDSPRVRFNWGYHDGASDAQHKRPIREPNIKGWPAALNRAYRQGYEAGVRDVREARYSGNSDAAWREMPQP
jgi:hypothetical protein